MANELRSYPIRNLIQGVSQQNAQQRRDTQCEAQFDCVNSPINGCEARPHADLIKVLSGAAFSDAFIYEIFRGDVEHYLVVVTSAVDGTGKRLHVYNWDTGAACAITFTATDAYLATTGKAKDTLVATTLEDVTFLGNREKIMRMSTTNLSPAKDNDAIIFFKAGGYSVTFKCVIHVAGVSYAYTYLTPDNSVSGNAAYIATNQLAAIFYKGFTGASPPTSGGTGGVQAAAPELAAATSASGDLLTSIGFSVFINGSCLKLSRADNAPYTVDCTDGVGDTYMMSIKDTAKAFSDLPNGCFLNFTTRVVGTNKQTDDDYYVKFTGADGITGSWQECVAPSTSLTPDPATMPMALTNTGLNTFELKQVAWGKRVSGDGINSALDPSFVGKPPQDLFYDNGRLGILTEGSGVWSRARNPYVFFPDTAQTTLATDPIDLTIGGGKRIALLRRVIQINEATFLWAQKLQFRVSSGVNPFKLDTVESKLSTSYEFAPLPIPCAVGHSLYFAAEPGSYATIRDLSVDVNGRAQGAVDVTAHVKKYIPAGVRIITASDTLGLVFITSDATPDRLYVYNYLLSTTDRIQSAWNIWRLPPNSTIIWASLSHNYLFLLLQRSDGAMMVRIDLSVDIVDTDAGATYLTRLDLRTTEATTTRTYDAATDTTAIVMPYTMTDVAGWSDTDATKIDTCPMFVACRATSTTSLRGKSFWVKSITSTTISVAGDVRAESLYLGYRITAERKMSRFYLKDQFGVVDVQRLTVKGFSVGYAGSGYFKVRVGFTNQAPKFQTMTGRTFGDPSNKIGQFPISEGFLKVPINSESFGFDVTLINDSFLPSRWTTAKYDYVASFLAKPTPGQGSGGNT
jgi:hypothetical protein